MAKHEGPYGMIISSWKKSGDKVKYDVSVPPNSTATLFLYAHSISEGGKDVFDNKYIRVEKVKDKPFILYLEAGNYHFLFDTVLKENDGNPNED